MSEELILDGCEKINGWFRVLEMYYLLVTGLQISDFDTPRPMCAMDGAKPNWNRKSHSAISYLLQE
jgi:hypothetical protein